MSFSKRDLSRDRSTWAFVGASVTVPAPWVRSALTPVLSPVIASAMLELVRVTSAPKWDTSSFSVFSAGTPLKDARSARSSTRSFSLFGCVKPTLTPSTSMARTATARAAFFPEDVLGFLGLGLISFCRLLVPSAYFSISRPRP